MLGAAHAMANPVTARKNIDHGIAVGLFLPHVIEYNIENNVSLYKGFFSVKNIHSNGHPESDILINHLNRYFDLANMPKNLSHYGIGENDIESLAFEADENWTAKFNPRPVNKEDFLKLYKNAL
jgi:alcohol dehydrogenase